ncbi:hypothetical protein BH10BAC4_BH10BAC4_04810 [soil metagenome]
MKLFDTVLLSLSVVFIIISIYEVMAVGLGPAYLWIMLTLLLMFVYTYRKLFKV